MHVVNTLYVFRLYAFFIHELFVIRNIFVNMLYLFYDFFGLELFQLINRHGFQIFLIKIIFFFLHVVILKTEFVLFTVFRA